MSRRFLAFSSSARYKRNEMKKSALTTILLIFVLISFSCAPGPNGLEKTPDDEGHIAGFLHGFWHGLIAPITFIVSIFTKNVHLYEVHNNGTWYDFGFVLGAGLSLSGGILGKKKKKKSK